MADWASRTQTEPWLEAGDSLPDAEQYPADYPFARRIPPQGEQVPSLPPSKSGLLGHTAEELPSPLAGAWWIVLAFGCGPVNFVLAPLVEAFDAAPIVVSVAYAVLIAELAGQSLWIVWSQRPLWLRLVIGTLVGEALLACFLVGIWVSEGHGSDFTEMVRILLCSLPLVMLSVQAPLWALRIYGRWRIIQAGPAPLEAPRPLAIGDICAATIVVALAVSLVRLASSDAEFYETAWLGWLIAVPIIAAVSGASLAPAIYGVLRWDRRAVGLLVWWGYAAFLMVTTLVLISTISGERIRGEGYVIALVTVIGSGALVWALLCFLRGRGYRLVTQ